MEWSGTSALLHITLDDLEYSVTLADARPCATVGELARRIAAAAVASRAPEASRWWQNRRPLSDTDGLRLGHALHRKGLDVERLRQGDGPDSRLLGDALRMACVLGDGPTLVAVDHLDRLLDRLDETSAGECLGVMRTVRQALPDLQLLLVGRRKGQWSAPCEIQDIRSTVPGRASTSVAQYRNGSSTTRAITSSR